jgi:hypothetical protein
MPMPDMIVELHASQEILLHSIMENMNEAENEARMARGELFHAFLPSLLAKRNRCVSTGSPIFAIWPYFGSCFS